MGGEINVAYQGTFGDLTAGGNAALYDDMHGDFNFDSFTNDDGLVDGGASIDFTAINGNATGTTVSPKDIFNNASVPPSTAFTNLTTPGSTTLETPVDDYETSPLFNSNIEFDGKQSNWFSLFPEVDNSTAHTGGAPLIRNSSGSSISNKILIHAGGESMQRKRSSTGASPAMVSKPATPVIGRKRAAKELPPIFADESDIVGLKRARNTAAARKSRAKKVQERDEMEARIAELETRNAELEAKCAKLEQERVALKATYGMGHPTSLSAQADDEE